MDTGLKGKKALITGGATGIGLGIAKSLAEEGVELAVASRHPDSNGLELLRRVQPVVHSIVADVSSEGGVNRMVSEAIERLGGLDLYINNAAVAAHEPITRLTAKALRRTLATNTEAAIFACREVARHFIRQSRGAILVVGSTASYTPAYQEIAYRISKTALLVLVQNLALELAPWRIRVNMVIPGHYPTRLTAGVPPGIASKLTREIPLRRFGDPLADIGPAATLLLSDRLSGYTTGAALFVDGGLSLRALNFCADEELQQLNES